MRSRLVVNGSAVDLDIEPAERLLSVLRRRLGLTGTKQACGVGECGACTVLVGGQPRLACLTLAVRVDADVLTVEGLADVAPGLRRSFAEQGAMQCGFCTPGQLMSAHHAVRAAADGEGAPSQDSLREHMVGNVCRCTGYAGILRAITEQIERESSE